MNILSWFTHSKHDLQLHVPPKQYDLLSCVEYKRKHFEMCSCFVCVYTIEANGLQSCVAPNALLYFKKERNE